jgi:hypothetical protein
MSKRQGLSWRLSYDDADGTRINVEDGGDLDEVVIDQWCHIERMDRRAWWLRIGDAWVWAHVGPDGRAEVKIMRGEYDGLGGWTTAGGGTVEQVAIKRPSVKPVKRKARKRG